MKFSQRHRLALMVVGWFIWLIGIAAIAGGVIASFFGFKSLIAFMVVAATLSFLLILYYVRVRRREK